MLAKRNVFTVAKYIRSKTTWDFQLRDLWDFCPLFFIANHKKQKRFIEI